MSTGQPRSEGRPGLACQAAGLPSGLAWLGNGATRHLHSSRADATWRVVVASCTTPATYDPATNDQLWLIRCAAGLLGSPSLLAWQPAQLELLACPGCRSNPSNSNYRLLVTAGSPDGFPPYYSKIKTAPACVGMCWVTTDSNCTGAGKLLGYPGARPASAPLHVRSTPLHSSCKQRHPQAPNLLPHPTLLCCHDASRLPLFPAVVCRHHCKDPGC